MLWWGETVIIKGMWELIQPPSNRSWERSGVWQIEQGAVRARLSWVLTLAHREQLLKQGLLGPVPGIQRKIWYSTGVSNLEHACLR